LTQTQSPFASFALFASLRFRAFRSASASQSRSTARSPPASRRPTISSSGRASRRRSRSAAAIRWWPTPSSAPATEPSAGADLRRGGARGP
jgi:hypothetical protein